MVLRKTRLAALAALAAVTAGVAGLYWLPEREAALSEDTEPAAISPSEADWAVFWDETSDARKHLMRHDAMRLAGALEDIDGFFSDYEAGIEAFVDELYSLSGKWALLRHLSRDLVDLPDEARQILETEWKATIGDRGLWSSVRSGEILDVVAAVALHGYSFSSVEGYVGSLWRKHFDERLDLDKAIAARLDRLRYELTANRNDFALQMQGKLGKLDEALRLAALEMPLRIEQEMAAVVTERGAAMAGTAIGVELLALAGSETAAVGGVLALRGMSSRAASAATRTLAGSIAARVGTRAAAWMGSRFVTVGGAILVAVIVDYGADRYFKSQMTSELQEYFASYRKAMWVGSEGVEGLHPQLTTAFLDYHDLLEEVVQTAVEKTVATSGMQFVQAKGAPGDY